MSTSNAQPLDPDFPATWAGGHALVIEFGDEEMSARCQCGAKLGSGTPATSLDEYGLPWERHVMTLPRAVTCRHCRRPVERCGKRAPHAGCASSLGWLHVDGAHACEARSDGPYATPDETAEAAR